MLPDLYPPTQRLLDLHDTHGALLAEFDTVPAARLLYVRWHGHLTAGTVIQGTQAAMQLRHADSAPLLLLNDKSLTSGDWSDALPWLNYEWLPGAVAAGLKAVAYVRSPDPTSQTGTQEFINAVRLQLPLGIFHAAAPAFKWLNRRG
ncbi:MAG: hypothetical protein EOO36_13430 [Cytophagaceae bacterium]|nr:MAG: hypothetical protein EOO36_13430 [Cytophagaceae bacterium]